MARVLLGWLALVALGCGTSNATPQPNLAAWTPPPDWVTVSNEVDSIQLTLPPYIVLSDNHGAIFANEPPRGGGQDIPIQVWAEGPVLDDGPRDGEGLAAWVDRRLDSPIKGPPTVTRVSLPAGAGIRYDRLDAAGTPNPWRIVVFAIDSRRGAAWLMIDGPPDEWAARADDLEHAAMLFRIK